MSERIHVTRSRANPGGMDVKRVLGEEVQPFRGRKPPWFKVPPPGGPKYRELTDMIKSEGLHTVCQEAACPNVGECWERGTATFMILGDTCTRRCGFCNVKTGKPTWNDPLEPARVARSVAKMGLRHAVITSVDRDDLPDYGASAFVGVIRSIRMQAPECKVEVLTPDFRGEEMPLAKVIAERPDVFNHNVEVVPRLYPVARRGSRWERSLRVLSNAKEMGGDEVVTKSGLMVGLGETHDEMVEAFGALREHGVQVLTVGPVPAPDRAPPAGRALLAPGRVQGARGRRLRARLRPHRRRPARALELPRRPARAAVPARDRPAGRRRLQLFPLKDNIPTDRFPVVTVTLIVLNVLAYFLWQRGGHHAGRPVEPALPRQPRPLLGVPVRGHAPGPAVHPGQRARRSSARSPTAPSTTCRRRT